MTMLVLAISLIVSLVSILKIARRLYLPQTATDHKMLFVGPFLLLGLLLFIMTMGHVSGRGKPVYSLTLKDGNRAISQFVDGSNLLTIVKRDDSYFFIVVPAEQTTAIVPTSSQPN